MPTYTFREALKELRLRVETTDPLYYGQKKLRLRGKDLQAIPRALFSIMELEVLDLSPSRQSCLDFKLNYVSPSIGKLINLRVLMLDTNELSFLPKEICLLQSLERLSLSNNMLEALPHGFNRLKGLKSLHMANNNFRLFPVDLCELPELAFLDMSDNQLATLPEQIGKLTNLTTLLLLYNRLIGLPDSICKLSELQCLWLGNNHLRELPRHFGDLTRLDWGYRYTSSILEGNPLTHPPLNICRMGPRAIETFLKDLNERRHQSSTESEDPKIPGEETKEDVADASKDDTKDNKDSKDNKKNDDKKDAAETKVKDEMKDNKDDPISINDIPNDDVHIDEDKDLP